PESVGLDRLHPGFSEPRVYSHLIQWSIRNYGNIQSHKLKLHPFVLAKVQDQLRTLEGGRNTDHHHPSVGRNVE
ncbi:MAG: hypothetical protein M1600_05930, partial [Firmicutes bacterium]|nr:hypothetical protein [Bacillota bacterium]